MVQLKRPFEITSDVTRAQLYDGDGNIKYPVLNTSKTNTEFSLYQNVPNPFSDFTDVSFELEKSQEVQITVFDAQGQVIRQINQSYEKGLNSVNFSVEDLGGAGIYYLTLKTESHTATMKMAAIR